jgi:Zn finger protein HypA/HybF involved in hydrogenase expression
MGIRFQCHVCNEPLHVKFFQAGKRGRCPHCQSRFRIPNEDSEFSIPLEGLKWESNSAAKIAADPKSPPAEESIASVATLEAPPSESPANETRSVSLPSDARWFVRPPSGGVYGPADTRTLEAWIAQRRLTADSYIWREGMEIWSVAIELMPEAFASESAPPPVSSPTTSPTAPSVEGIPNPALAKAKANLEQRRKKKRKQTWIALGLLSAVAVGLLVMLFLVLRR